MNEFDYVVRAENLIKDLNIELEVINLDARIEDEIREKFEKEQMEHLKLKHIIIDIKNSLEAPTVV